SWSNSRFHVRGCTACGRDTLAHRRSRQRRHNATFLRSDAERWPASCGSPARSPDLNAPRSSLALTTLLGPFHDPGRVALYPVNLVNTVNPVILLKTQIESNVLMERYPCGCSSFPGLIDKSVFIPA